jgi:hypothetical protein
MIGHNITIKLAVVIMMMMDGWMDGSIDRQTDR